MTDSAETDASKAATPVFGAASTFGAGTGFAGFAGADTAKKDTPAKEEDGEEPAGGEAEEDCQAEFKPLVQLQEVETVSGEEGDIVLLDFKSKLYRFDNDSGEWKERGVGQTKLLENKANRRIRLLMRQEKTLKIRANHVVMPGTKLQEHSGSEKAWVYSTVDFAEEEMKMELFCLRFASVERAAEFRKKFEEAMAHNEKVLAADEEGGAAEEAAAEAAEKADAKQKEDADLAKAVSEQATLEKPAEGEKGKDKDKEAQAEAAN